MIKIQFLNSRAKIPTNKQGDAGYDLYYSGITEVVLKPHDRYGFETGIAMEIPNEYYGSIRDRSGKAYKDGLHVLAGVIDPSYRGEIKVVLLNTNNDREVIVKPGDKIAQLIFERYHVAHFEIGDLSDTERGEKGFGSSGN